MRDAQPVILYTLGRMVSFLIYLYEHMHINEQQLIQLLRGLDEARIPLGRLALEKGMLSMAQVFGTLRQSADKNQRFGEACIQLGFLNRDELTLLLGMQQEKLPTIQTLLIDLDLFDLAEARELHNAYLRTLV